MDNNIYFKKAGDFILQFASIIWEAMPFIVLGAVISGILQELLPQRLVIRILPRNRFLSILCGGFLGIIFPICECGIIPIMRRLIRKSVPLSCCTAYLLAGPIVNVVVMASTFKAFEADAGAVDSKGISLNQMGSWWMTGFRCGIGYLIAVTTSLVVERMYRKYGNSLLTALTAPSALPLVDDEEAADAKKPLMTRLGNISETALHDFTDIMVYLVIGALMTCTVQIWLTKDDIAQYSTGAPMLAILLMMALAVLLCLCSEADAGVAASLITLRPSAKLAFLTLGPMMDLKLFMMYTRVFRPRLIWTIILCVVVQVFFYAVLVHYLWENGLCSRFAHWIGGLVNLVN